MTMQLPPAITLIEVGPRDGLQNEAEILSVEQKVDLIERLQAANVPEMEVGSFVSPKAVPQMAGTDEVYAAISKKPGLIYHALVPNQRGYENARAAGISNIRLVVAAAEPLHQANFRKTIQESLDEHSGIIEQAKADGIAVEAVIGASWGDPFVGPTPISDVMRCVAHYHQQGIRDISVADTIGMGTPKHVHDLISTIQSEYPDVIIGTHFHDTRGTGLANVLAALELGVTRFDAAIGGTGGCPFAPKAGGNICSEDVVHMLYGMGVDTGIDFDRMVHTAKWMEEVLNKPLPSKMIKADPVYPVFRSSQKVPVRVASGS
jgi:isopropylmalate/homocitrate/citramalate synthase